MVGRGDMVGVRKHGRREFSGRKEMVVGKEWWKESSNGWLVWYGRREFEW